MPVTLFLPLWFYNQQDSSTNKNNSEFSELRKGKNNNRKLSHHVYDPPSDAWLNRDWRWNSLYNCNLYKWCNLNNLYLLKIGSVCVIY